MRLITSTAVCSFPPADVGYFEWSPTPFMLLPAQQAQHLLTLPTLQRFFDPQYYCKACNEMSYINARGELRRIDRLVEFDNEVWVLDYKSGATSVSVSHSVQMQEYRIG